MLFEMFPGGCIGHAPQHFRQVREEVITKSFMAPLGWTFCCTSVRANSDGLIVTTNRFIERIYQ